VKNFLSAVIFFVVFGNFSLVSAGIDERCRSKWGENFRMVEFCIEQNKNSRLNVAEKDRKFSEGSKKDKIIENCGRKWRDEHGFNWRMIEFCVSQQIESYRNVREPKNFRPKKTH